MLGEDEKAKIEKTHSDFVENVKFRIIGLVMSEDILGRPLLDDFIYEVRKAYTEAKRMDKVELIGNTLKVLVDKLKKEAGD